MAKRKKKKDVVGLRFGRLTVLGYAESGRMKALVRCDCGTEKLVQVGALRAGLTKSCGMHRLQDLVGLRFGRWVVLSLSGRRYGVQPFWNVRCDCGEERAVSGQSLREGKSVSCGCFKDEMHTTHGMEATKVYSVWAGMKARCSNPKHRAFKHYGGRGITVCKRWEKFENFLADMGAPTGVLDRIDVNGNYTPRNCRWTTWSVSAQNQRRYLKPKD